MKHALEQAALLNESWQDSDISFITETYKKHDKMLAKDHGTRYR